MPVDAQLQLMLDALSAMPPIELGPDSAPEMRAGYAAMTMLSQPGSDSVVVSDLVIPGPAGDIPTRVYRPEAGGVTPVLVWFHGGGFVIGDLDTADGQCRLLAEGAGVSVVSVDYRLAPEHPYPAAVDDCLAATRWVGDHVAELGVDPAWIAVGGDSAGGNLAAVIAQQVRDGGGPRLACQMLVYPVTDLVSHVVGPSTASLVENGEGYFLTADTMRWFAACYVPDGGEVADPRVSPLRAGSLAGLPPAIVMTCGFDPLRDEGKAYADALEAAGVPVVYHCCSTGIHGLLAMSALADVGREFVEFATASLRDALGTSPVTG